MLIQDYALEIENEILLLNASYTVKCYKDVEHASQSRVEYRYDSSLDGSSMYDLCIDIFMVIKALT